MADIGTAVKTLGGWLGTKEIFDQIVNNFFGKEKTDTTLVKDKFEQSKLFNQLAESLKSINFTEAQLSPELQNESIGFPERLQAFLSNRSIRFFNNTNTLEFVKSMINFISSTKNFVNYDPNYGQDFINYIKKSLSVGKTLTEIDSDLNAMLEKIMFPSYIILRLRGETNSAKLVLILQNFGKLDQNTLKDFANIEKESTLLYGEHSSDFDLKIENEQALETFMFYRNLAENKIYNLQVDTNISYIEDFKRNIANLLNCKDETCISKYIGSAIDFAKLREQVGISLNTYNPAEAYQPNIGSK